MNDQVNQLKIFFLISAILNIIYGIGWIIYTIFGGLITCGIWCIFGAIPVINVIACVMDFVAYTKLNGENKTGTFSSVQFAAIFDIITILSGNLGSMVFGTIALFFLNNNEVKEYLRQKGIY